MARKPVTNLAVNARRPKSRKKARRGEDELLRNIAAGVSAATGDDFFRSLVRYLAKTLGVDFAFVGELTGEDKQSVNTVSVCTRSKIVDDFRYDLTRTPCENVVTTKGLCTYPQNVQQLFSKDRLLAEMGVESYMGTPLRATSGEILGLMVVMDSKPLEDPKTAESMLQIFATRASAELERKQAEAALRESEANLRTLAENAKDGILVNMGGKHVFASRQLADMLGYTVDELLGTTIDDLVHPDQRDFVKKRHERRLEGESEPDQYELVFVDKQGESIPTEITVSTSVWQGQPAGIVIVRDVRERKWVDEELGIRARQQAVVAELGQHALADIGLDTLIDRAVGLVAGTLKVEYCKVLELLPDGNTLLLRAGEGWKKGLVGRAVVDAGINSQAVYTLLSSSPVIVEDLRTETRFNGPTLLHDHGVVSGVSVIIHGKERPFGILGVHTKTLRRFSRDDINFLRAVANVLAAAIERKQTEETLRKSRASLAEAQRIARVGNWGWETVTNDLYWSDEVYRIFGLVPQEFEVTYEAFLKSVHPEDREHVKKAVNEALYENKYYDIDFRIVRPDGEVRVVHGQAEVTRYESGKPIRMVGTVQDVTEHRRAEEVLRESEKKYRDLVANALVGVYRSNLKGETLYVNDALLRIFEYDSVEEIMAVGVSALYRDKKRRDVLIEKLKKVSKVSNFEVEVVTKTGKSKTVLLNATLDGDVLSGMIMDITERHRTDAQLRLQGVALEAAADGIVITDQGGNIQWVNPAYTRMTGYRLDEVVGENLRVLKSGKQDQSFYKQLWDTILTGKSWYGELINKRKDGSLYPEEQSITPVLDKNGEIAHFIAIKRDITKHRQIENVTARLGRILDQSANEIYVFDATTLRFSQVSQGARENLGYSMEELESLTPVDLKPEFTQKMFAKLIEPLRNGEKEYIAFETVHRRKNGSLYPVEARLQLSHRETPQVFVSIIQDITERMQTQERLHHLAHHDVLTDLPNRMLFMDRLEHALSRARRAGCLVAVLFLDMDRFKIINDTLGHDVGDRLLQAFGLRLCACVRDGDTVARHGGDEFVIVLEDVATVDDVPAMARKILNTLAQPFQIDDRELFMTSSIGISLHPSDGQDAPTLLKNADTAMYRAKGTGRNTYQFYSADMSAKAFERLTLETSLRHALKREEFLLYYQPQVDMGTGRIVGVEALLRLQHPDLGLVLPGDFIPLLEDTGLIVPVGEWVLRSACVQAKTWQHAGLPPVRLTVNLSARQFAEPNLTDAVARVLKEVDLDPALLELEITESVIMQNAQATIDTLAALGNMGLRFAIDDFGTGYSSLSYLKRFSINTLKIDRSFVRDITTDTDDTAIITTIAAMAHNLKLNVVAEGVETEEQLAFLRASGCDGFQGYLFSRPVPTKELARLLQQKMVPKNRAGAAARD